MEKSKEFLYVGYYRDINDNFILKIGTTNDLERRRQEHNRNYRNAKEHRMSAGEEFTYLWNLPLSKYNTLRFEDYNRQRWQEMGIGEFIRNDRFILETIPEFVEIAIRKTYRIPLNF